MKMLLLVGAKGITLIKSGHIFDDMADEKKTILILEDDNQIAELYRSAFGDNYKILHVTSADDALQHLPQAQLAILDRHQPTGMGGDKLLEEMVKNYSHIPAIMVSGNYTQKPPSGAIEYMQKPISIFSLKQKVDELFPPEAA